MSELEINVLLPKADLWARIQRLVHPTNLADLMQKHAQLHWFSSGDRLERLVWQPLTDPLAQKPVDKKELGELCRAIEGGVTPPSIASIRMRLGHYDEFYRSNEQLFVDLVLSPADSINRQTWCKPDQFLLTLWLPTGNIRGQQDQNCIRPLLGLVFELLQPTFAFSCNENSYDEFYGKPYQAPWEFYWDTMVFGPSLVKQLSLEHLRATPAFRMVELEGPMIWISDVSGIGDESFDTHYAHLYHSSNKESISLNYGDNSLFALKNFMSRAHRQAVINHLTLNRVRGSSENIETEAQEKFFEWMVKYWPNQ